MKQWQYYPSPSTNQSMAESLTVFPREKDMTCAIVRVFWNVCLRIFLRLYFRLTIRGKENLPQSKSFVLIANHTSHLDAICLTAALPIKSINRIFSVAAKDCFFSSLTRTIFSAVCVNALPFDRKHKHKESLELCAEVLNVSNQVLIMFPEGSRSLTGEIQTFKGGIGLLVAGTERQVVPVYIDGAHRAWSKGSCIFKPKRVRLMIGKSLNFSHVKRNKEGYEKVARLCESAVRDLSKT